MQSLAGSTELAQSGAGSARLRGGPFHRARFRSRKAATRRVFNPAHGGPARLRRGRRIEARCLVAQNSRRFRALSPLANRSRDAAQSEIGGEQESGCFSQTSPCPTRRPGRRCSCMGPRRRVGLVDCLLGGSRGRIEALTVLLEPIGRTTLAHGAGSR